MPARSASTVSSATAVAKSIREPGVYTGQLPAMAHADWQKNLAQLRRLDALADRIRALEKALRDVQASAASQRGDEVE
jgi:UDP-3-O-[3-hydroxymyristoyl] glucosamine N-acyltransferase